MFERKVPLKTGRGSLPQYTDSELDQVVEVLVTGAPDLWSVFERNAREPGSISKDEYGKVFDELALFLTERKFIYTYTEMAVIALRLSERIRGK